MSAILSTYQLSCSLGGRKILDNLSINIFAGETIGLIGPNGSGKSTLLNCLSGFVPISSGQIQLNNTRIDVLSPAKRAALGLGRVFQNPGIFRELSVEENMLIAVEARQPWYRKYLLGANQHSRDRINTILEQINLLDKRRRNAAELSGGELRLLEIGRTLLFGAELFLLDEPTAGVSPLYKQEVGKMIQSLQSQGKTLVIVEHDLRFIAEYCTKLIVLESGNIALEGDVETVRNSSLIKEIYLGSARNQ